MDKNILGPLLENKTTENVTQDPVALTTKSTKSDRYEPQLVEGDINDLKIFYKLSYEHNHDFTKLIVAQKASKTSIRIRIYCFPQMIVSSEIYTLERKEEDELIGGAIAFSKNFQYMAYKQGVSKKCILNIVDFFRLGEEAVVSIDLAKEFSFSYTNLEYKNCVFTKENTHLCFQYKKEGQILMFNLESIFTKKDECIDSMRKMLSDRTIAQQRDALDNYCFHLSYKCGQFNIEPSTRIFLKSYDTDEYIYSLDFKEDKYKLEEHNENFWWVTEKGYGVTKSEKKSGVQTIKIVSVDAQPFSHTVDVSSIPKIKEIIYLSKRVIVCLCKKVIVTIGLKDNVLLNEVKIQPKSKNIFHIYNRNSFFLMTREKKIYHLFMERKGIHSLYSYTYCYYGGLLFQDSTIYDTQRRQVLCNNVDKSTQYLKKISKDVCIISKQGPQTLCIKQKQYYTRSTNDNFIEALYDETTGKHFFFYHSNYRKNVKIVSIDTETESQTESYIENLGIFSLIKDQEISTQYGVFKCLEPNKTKEEDGFKYTRFNILQASGDKDLYLINELNEHTCLNSIIPEDTTKICVKGKFILFEIKNSKVQIKNYEGKYLHTIPYDESFHDGYLGHIQERKDVLYLTSNRSYQRGNSMYFFKYDYEIDRPMLAQVILPFTFLTKDNKGAIERSKGKEAKYYQIMHKGKKVANGVFETMKAIQSNQVTKFIYSSSGEVEVVFHHDMDMKPLGFLKTEDRVIRINNYKEAAALDIPNLVKQIQTKFTSDYYCTFDNNENFLHFMALRPQILEQYLSQLSLMRQEQVPILIQRRLADGKSPLDIAIAERNSNSQRILLEILLKYQNDLCFNYLVDEQLCDLLDQGLDLRDYFESNLPCYQIKDERFVNLHKYSKSQVYGSNVLMPQDVLEQYEDIIGKHLPADDTLEAQQQSMEFYIVNMPYCLTHQKRELVKSLVDNGTQEYFESLPVQILIQFKWDNYTQNYFKKQFYIFQIFFLCNIANIYYSLYSKDVDQSGLVLSDTRLLYISIPLDILCGGILCYFAQYEIRQIHTQGLLYFSELWNWIDTFLALSYIPMVVLDYLESQYIMATYLQVLVISLSFLKICFFLRIYEGFGFLVSLMSGVFTDIKYFFALWVLFLCWFGIIFTVLFQGIPISDQSDLNWFGYFIMSYRISAGDSDFDAFTQQKSELKLFTWLLWMISLFTLNVMFMNFIIAVISESYEKVMQRLVALSFMLKAEMIVERESLMADSDFTNPEHFPRFLILRRAVGADVGSQEEWQGFIKDIKQTLKITSQKTEQNLQNQLNMLKTQISTVLTEAKAIQASSTGNKTLLSGEVMALKGEMVAIKTVVMEKNAAMKAQMEEMMGLIKALVQEKQQDKAE